jgi:hypothetical protein
MEMRCTASLGQWSVIAALMGCTTLSAPKAIASTFQIPLFSKYVNFDNYYPETKKNDDGTEMKDAFGQPIIVQKVQKIKAPALSEGIIKSQFLSKHPKAPVIYPGDPNPTGGPPTNKLVFKGYSDPWSGYQYLLSNPSEETEFFSISFDMPVTAFGPNVLTAELTLELLDTNGDGQASLKRFGMLPAIQRATLIADNGQAPTAPNWDLGSQDLTSPGIYTYVLPAASAPMDPDYNRLFVSSDFSLSPGDTVQLRGLIVIDDGTSVPTPEIPDLNEIVGEPFAVVINSPDWVFEDNDWLGSLTQVNVSEGGSIGQRFNFAALMNNTIQDEPLYSEVNIMGGTVGHQFMALSGTKVNISGGTTNGIFYAGRPFGQSSDVEVNITGGRVGAGSNGGIQSYVGSVVNISGGTVAPLKAYGGVVYLSGGLIDIPIASGSGVEISSDSIVNISAGAFDTVGEILVLDGVLNISGGSIITANQEFSAFESGDVNLFGKEFRLDGQPIEGQMRGVPLEITDRGKTLSGILTDGSPFSIDLNPTSVPTPGGDLVHPNATLTVTLALPGDLNNNGFVDAADYVVWANNRGSSNTLPNDTSPGLVTQHDYDVWRSNFGSASATGVSNAVPEPSTFVLLLLGLVELPRNGGLLSFLLCTYRAFSRTVAGIALASSTKRQSLRLQYKPRWSADA